MRVQHLAHWNIEGDVLGMEDYVGDLLDQTYRTIIASRGSTLPHGSIVLCARFEDRYGGHKILAIGKVTNKTSVATGRIRVRVDPFLALSSPIDLATVRSKSDHYVSRALGEAFLADPLSPKLFTRRTKDRLLSAISEVNPQAESILADLSQGNQGRVSGIAGMRLREERDAVSTAFQLAGIEIPDRSYPADPMSARTNLPFATLELPSSSLSNEDDLIAHDLRRFDEDMSRYALSPAAYRFVDNGFTLTVINVNRKPLEQALGVDLVYFDSIRNQATAVQYKRLERVRTNGQAQWIYRRKAELRRQLALMLQPTRPVATSSADWRLSPCPTFFKFVRAEDFDPGDQRLLRGMYVPSEYLALGMQDATFNTGPRGGFRIGCENTRYLTRSVFVELVRRGWIGTVPEDQPDLGEAVAQLAKDHEVVFAILSRAN